MTNGPKIHILETSSNKSIKMSKVWWCISYYSKAFKTSPLRLQNIEQIMPKSQVTSRKFTQQYWEYTTALYSRPSFAPSFGPDFTRILETGFYTGFHDRVFTQIFQKWNGFTRDRFLKIQAGFTSLIYIRKRV